MKVKDIMSENIITMQDSEPVARARNLMIKNNISHVLVTNDTGDPLGIVTEKDITHKLNVDGPNWKRRPVDKIAIHRIMSDKLLTISTETEFNTVADVMLKNNIGALPVVNNNEFIGMITKSDLLKVYINKFSGRWKVSDLMTSTVETVNENHTLSHIINLFHEKNIGRVIVVRDNSPIGIITSQDITFAQIDDPKKGVNQEKISFMRSVDELEEKRNVRKITMLSASDIMITDLITIESNIDASEVAKILSDNKITGLPVIENNELLGIITKTDILKAIQ